MTTVSAGLDGDALWGTTKFNDSHDLVVCNQVYAVSAGYKLAGIRLWCPMSDYATNKTAVCYSSDEASAAPAAFLLAQKSIPIGAPIETYQDVLFDDPVDFPIADPDHQNVLWVGYTSLNPDRFYAACSFTAQALIPDTDVFFPAQTGSFGKTGAYKYDPSFVEDPPDTPSNLLWGLDVLVITPGGDLVSSNLFDQLGNEREVFHQDGTPVAFF